MIVISDFLRLGNRGRCHWDIFIRVSAHIALIYLTPNCLPSISAHPLLVYHLPLVGLPICFFIFFLRWKISLLCMIHFCLGIIFKDTFFLCNSNWSRMSKPFLPQILKCWNFRCLLSYLIFIVFYDRPKVYSCGTMVL